MPVQKGYVDTRIGQLHYRSAGTSGSVIILLHQTASSSRMYEALMECLEEKFRLIAFDTPGFGNSAAFPSAPSLTDFSDVLHEATESLDLQNFHLLGHHTGAAVATQWAADQPEVARSLTLIGALGMGAAERRRWLDQMSEHEGTSIQADGKHFADAWSHVSRIDANPMAFPPSPELQHREAVDVLLATPRWEEAYLAVFTHDYEKALERVMCPVLLICGDEDVLYPYLEDTAALKPDASIFTLNGGAYILEQDLNQVLTVIKDFYVSASAIHL